MEAKTDIQTYLEQGKQALAQGQGREAAIAYAHGAQMDTDNPQVHLGLAEANLALGNYGVVHMACKRVQELQPNGGKEGWTAQALLDLLDRRYDRALQNIDAVVSEEPSIAYAHALRSYVLRAMGQDYDANLARARAARLSYGGRFEGCFPALDEKPVYGGYKGNSASSTASKEGAAPETSRSSANQEQVPTWSRPSPMRRQVIRTRFALSQYPNLVTTLLVAINVIVYLLISIIGVNGNIIDNSHNSLLAAWGEVGQYVLAGEYWRIFTAMFLHLSILHVGLNMLSLFLVGRAVEVLYGKWRYLAIYLLSGILGGIVALFFTPPDVVSVGASGAIFGVFGAIGVFFIVNRRALGAFGNGAIGQWIFWLGLNLIWGFTTPGIGILDHIGGLVAGMVIALILMPRQRRRSRMF
ncbi:MAG: rhomboid family intramembrane serine protease [Ktedonobacteraceae bacterium]|nr:rhomboid family intramembrane serine protease [Ktedonobacteraceae bacterium]